MPDPDEKRGGGILAALFPTKPRDLAIAAVLVLFFVSFFAVWALGRPLIFIFGAYAIMVLWQLFSGRAQFVAGVNAIGRVYNRTTDPGPYWCIVAVHASILVVFGYVLLRGHFQV